MSPAVVFAAAVAAVVVVIAVLSRRRDGFASEGGPAGGLLIGGSFVAHRMNDAVSPCVETNPGTFAGALISPGAPNYDQIERAAKMSINGPRVARGFEKFSVRAWDERENFNPNPDIVSEPLLGLDMMGVRRKFNI
ncbi:MAG: hypothetical protein KGL39_23970 [Patescibacteria group bacterium]|nr:hypothetical protein [Patescibacteria group bacterium]